MRLCILEYYFLFRISFFPFRSCSSQRMALCVLHFQPIDDDDDASPSPSLSTSFRQKKTHQLPRTRQLQVSRTQSNQPHPNEPKWQCRIPPTTAAAAATDTATEAPNADAHPRIPGQWVDGDADARRHGEQGCDRVRHEGVRRQARVRGERQAGRGGTPGRSNAGRYDPEGNKARKVIRTVKMTDDVAQSYAPLLSVMRAAVLCCQFCINFV